jgi:DNA repair protein RecO (recombination protein O)
MKQVKTKAIILSRMNYGEADRILTLLTPDYGKVRAIAKAVRKSTSKLAGGIELFSVSDICYVVGRGELVTITSTRLVKHYGNIVKNLERTNVAYELLKLLDKVTEDHTEPSYFNCLEKALVALEDDTFDAGLTKLWFGMQLLRLAGHMPNLKDDTTGQKLQAEKSYEFDFNQMAFNPPASSSGSFGSDEIKFLRLGFAAERPHLLARIKDSAKLSAGADGLISIMLKSQIAG